MATTTDMVRHMLATLAYRLQTAVRGAPTGFESFDAGHGVRTPAKLIRHMSHVLKYAHRHLSADADVESPDELPFEKEVERFHELLARVDNDLKTASAWADDEILMQLIQGPLSDAMTHAGQLAMLRRLAGSPVRGQSFSAADIKAGQVGQEQSEPRKLFDG